MDPGFGTGMVKVTPAHDPERLRDGSKRVACRVLDVMTDEARMNENAPEAFRGLDRFEARKKVVAEFKALGLYGGDEVHVHSVPHCYRCHTRGGAALEPTVVCEHEASRRAGARGFEGRHHLLHPAALEEGLRDLDGEHPGLVHFATALVGPSNSGVVLCVM